MEQCGCMMQRTLFQNYKVPIEKMHRVPVKKNKLQIHKNYKVPFKKTMAFQLRKPVSSSLLDKKTRKF